MARVLEGFLAAGGARKLERGLILKSARDYAPKPGEHDFAARSDAPWIKRFAQDGGEIIISGDRKMNERPHERLALIETGLVVVFFGTKWAGWKFNRQSALIVTHWPAIVRTVRRAPRPSFWRVPTTWDEIESLESVPHGDKRLQRIERQKASRESVAAERRARRRSAPDDSDDLFPRGEPDGSSAEIGK